MDFDWDRYTELFKKFEFNIQKELLQDGISYSRGVVADMGCGIGRGFKYLPQEVQKLIYVDSSSEMIKEASINAQKVQEKLNIESVGVKGSIENLANKEFFDEHNVDTILFFNSLYPCNDPVAILNSTIEYLENRNSRLILANQGRDVNPTLIEKLREEVISEDLNDFELFSQLNLELMSKAPRTYCLDELISICERPSTTFVHGSESHFYNSCPLLVIDYNAQR